MDLNWIEKIYVSEEMQDVETVLYSLKREIPVLHVYLIAVEQQAKPRLVIISSAQALRSKTSHQALLVVGVAFGPGQARRLLADIVADASARYGTVDELPRRLMEETKK